MINPKNRVSQLDSRLLDNELFELLYQTLIDCFNVKNLPKRISDLKVKNNDELKLILKLILFKLTIYDKNSSYGLILSRLVMADADTNKNHNKLSLKKKYILLSLLVGEYLFKKLESLIYRDDFQEQDTDVTNDKISRLQKLSLKMLKMILPNISKVYSIAMLVNFLQFLIDGNYPTIAFRFSNIKLKPSPGSSSTALNSPENISYEFQNRQLVWNTLTEFLLFTLPILKLPKFSTRLINLVMGKNRNLKTDSATAEISAYGNTSLKECAICLLQEGNNATIGNNNDHSGLTSGNHNLITNPYITNCGHCYCYICILSKLEQYRGEKDHWKCLRCGQDVKWCKKFDDVDTKYIICNITTIGKQSSENIEKRNEQDNTEANAAEFINNTTEDEDEPENEPENDTGDDAEDDTEPANNGGFFVQ